MSAAQSVPFPGRGAVAKHWWLAAVAATWALVGWGVAAVVRESLRGPHWLGNPSPGLDQAIMVAASCASILLLWLADAVFAPGARRLERRVLRLWWPALVAGLALPFLTPSLARQVYRLSGRPAPARMAPRPAVALPDERIPVPVAYAAVWTYDDGLAYEMDGSNRVARVTRHGREDAVATARHRGRSAADLMFELGRPANWPSGGP